MHPVTENQHLTHPELQGCPTKALPHVRKARPCYLLGEKKYEDKSQKFSHACVHTCTQAIQEEISINFPAVETIQDQYAATHGTNACLIFFLSRSCRSWIIYSSQISKQ